METIKLGSQSTSVEDLRVALNHINLGSNYLPIVKTFDNNLLEAVKQYQITNGLVPDGIVGAKTWESIKHKTSDKFIISIHGGHGGIDPKTNKYTTAGKCYRHKGHKLHTEDGWFYEGVENRLIADEVAKRLRALGFFVITTHHEYNDDEGQLLKHYTATLPYIKRGYDGYTHSFHSNAAGSDDPVALEATQGGFVYTTIGVTISDYLAAKLLEIWRTKFGNWWVRMEDDRRRKDLNKKITISSDAEANYQVIRNVEGDKNINPLKSKNYGAILEEFGFMTSLKDTKFIIDPENREKRIQAAVELAQWYKSAYKTILEV